MSNPKNPDLSTSLQMVDKILNSLERLDKQLENLEKIISGSQQPGGARPEDNNSDDT